MALLRRVLLSAAALGASAIAYAQQPHLVHEFNAGANDDDPGLPVGVLGGRFLYNVGSNPNQGLWATSGTAATSTLLLPIPSPSFGGGLLSGGIARGDDFLFAITRLYDVPPPPDTLAGLWKTDGTPAGTELLQPIFIESASMANVGHLTVFGAFDGHATLSPPTEPWRTDGTPEGTALISTLVPGPSGSRPGNFVSIPGAAVFTVVNDPSPALAPAVWRTDGTPEGTHRLTSNTCFGLTRVGPRVFMLCEDTANGRELWVTEGTAATTRLVRDLTPGPNFSSILDITDLDGTALFARFEPGTNVMELWKSDGTEAGTVLVKDGFGPGLFTDPLLTASDGILYFIGRTAATGHELWRSDGTAAGTGIVKDIVFGTGDGVPALPQEMSLLAVPGGVLFRAQTPSTGLELWTSDGTEAGTVALDEIELGPGSAEPRLLANAGPAAYLTAFQTGLGRELWAVDLQPAVRVGDVDVAEPDAGTADAVFPIALTAPSATPVVVSYATASGTATSGVDFTPVAGTLTFAPGTVGPMTVTVPVNGDVEDERTEVFVLELSGVTGALVADSRGEAAILDDDRATVTLHDVTVTEGNAGTTPAGFGVTLTTPDGLPATNEVLVRYETESGTAAATFDFAPLAGVLTFPAGTPSGTTAIVTVSVVGDLTPEPHEQFFVSYEPLGDEILPDAVATGRILDDDGVEHAPPVELAHGSSLRADLTPLPGRTGDRDWYAVLQQPYASYEVVVDETSGDAAPIQVDRMAPDDVTVLESGTGSSVSLRWQNFASAAVSDEALRVSSPACGTGCSADDRYRVRLYETTLSAARFNQENGQATVVILQNPTSAPITGRILFWSPEGFLLDEDGFGLGAHGVLTHIPQLTGTAGSITVTHDGPYGAIVGKAVALQPATGFSFDTPLAPRRR